MLPQGIATVSPEELSWASRLAHLWQKACQVAAGSTPPASRSADLALGHGLGCLLLIMRGDIPLLQLRPTFLPRTLQTISREQYPILQAAPP